MRIPLFQFFCLYGWDQLPPRKIIREFPDMPCVQQLHKIKLSVLGLTYQWEKPVSRKSVLTLTLRAGLQVVCLLARVQLAERNFIMQ